MKETYQVVVSLVFPPGFEPHPREFRSVLECFLRPKLRLTGAFWSRGEFKDLVHGTKNTEFTIDEIIQTQLFSPVSATCATLFGGGVKADASGTAELYIALEDEGYMSGVRTLGSLTILASENLVTKLEGGAPQLLDTTLAAANQWNASYGFVDIIQSDPLNEFKFSTAGCTNLPLSEQTERNSWFYFKQPAGLARGVYWGNYFGPGMLDALGGRAAFSRRFRDSITNLDGSKRGHMLETRTGLFVSLSTELESMKADSSDPCTLILSREHHLWLQAELCKYGLLEPWPTRTIDSIQPTFDA